MIYRMADYQAAKLGEQPQMSYCMIHSAGTFGNEIYAALVSFAMQQVYDRYEAIFRLTREEYDAFPGNRDTLLSQLTEHSPRILLSHGGMTQDITAFDSDLLGPAPLGSLKESK